LKRFLIYSLVAITLGSCYFKEQATHEPPIATVNGNNLYKKDLHNLFRQNLPIQDSLEIVENFIENWVKEQLMLARAENNLSEEEKDVQEKLDNYRNSLLIYRYQEHYIKANLDTVISQEEITNYYNDNVQNFRLDNNLVKAIYVKISNALPQGDINQMVRWMHSDISDDKEKFYNFCLQYAESFDDFNNEWLDFNLIQMQFPYKIYSPETTLKWKKFFDTRDDRYLYYLRINDFVPKSEAAPLEFINEKIQSIILNKRKITLIRQLENEVYNDALNRNLIKTYE
jgi:hypothetical protein